MRALEDLGRVRLSANFFMRDFLFSEIADFYGIANIPQDPEAAIFSGRRLCEELLEPLQATFGRLALRSGYRAREVTDFGNKRGECGSVEVNAAYHIWDLPDRQGKRGAAVCLAIPWFVDRYEKGDDWRGLAWWIHDHLPYAHLEFYPKLAAFNIQWRETPARRIDSYIDPKGCLTKPGMPNHTGSHASWYEGFPALNSRTKPPSASS